MIMNASYFTTLISKNISNTTMYSVSFKFLGILLMLQKQVQQQG